MSLTLVHSKFGLTWTIGLGLYDCNVRIMRNSYLAMKSQFKENNFASSKFRYSFIFNFPIAEN